MGGTVGVQLYILSIIGSQLMGIPNVNEVRIKRHDLLIDELWHIACSAELVLKVTIHTCLCHHSDNDDITDTK